MKTPDGGVGVVSARWWVLFGTPTRAREHSANFNKPTYNEMPKVGNALKEFSGTQKATRYGEPNSRYTYLSGDGNYAVSNYICNSEGKVSYQVDFDNHGSGYLSGHSHDMTASPGYFRVGHLIENHVMDNLVPIKYHIIPIGVQYSSPIGH